MSIASKLIELRAERERLSAQIASQAKTLFATEVSSVFEQHPVLKSFGWRQYTPYFNDGSPCEFSASLNNPLINDEDSYDVWSTNEKISTGLDWKGDPYTPTDMDFAVFAVGAFLSNFDDDDMLLMFDDHATITVNRDGTVDVSEYDHE